ncbi:MAG: ABC transporter substrate-binding protein [Pedobacter sp.]|jgi:ABC-type nitrate/sulfonate/bicarbonate transport system substrate-binding protein/signal transduction histidine kinase
MNKIFCHQRFLIYFILFLFGAPSLKAQDLSPVKLQLKWHHQFQFAGYYAAQIKGFYKKEGLEVELFEGAGNINVVDEVISGNADFGVTASDILQYFSSGKPVVVISAIFQHNPYVIISLEKSGINTPSDLAGKKIMAAEDQGWPILRALFLKEGIMEEKMNVLQHSWNADDLISGKVDAISGYINVEPQYIRDMGYPVKIINPTDYGIDFYGDLIFTSRKIADRYPEKVERFNKATIQGWQYAMKHPEEIIDYILKLPGTKERGITRGTLLYEAQELQKLIMPEFVDVGHINHGRWETMLAIYKQLGLAKANTSLDDLLYISQSEKKADNSDKLLLAIGIGILSFAVALIINWRLRSLVKSRTKDLEQEINNRTEAEQRLELAIEAAGLGVWDRNLDTNEIQFDEERFRNIGCDPELFADHDDWLNNIHPDDQPSIRESVVAFRSGKSDYSNLTYRIKTKQGYWKWILSFSKIFHTETGRHVAGIILDIDVIKSKETELEKLTKALTKTNKELEKFAYITSHNLRAPVVNLLSLTEMQKEENLPDDLRKEVGEKIYESVIRLDSTLNDLVEIVASKASENAKSEKLDFQKELDQVLSSIEKQIKDSEARIDTDFSECDSVMYPKRYLDSILLNLLTNAIKYRSPERRLIISLKTSVNNNYVMLHFSDNGVGIDMERFGKKIFGLYQRFHTKIEGRGLGLYLVKSQIEAMDGKIGVESTLNIGTTFSIYFRKEKGLSA